MFSCHYNIINTCLHTHTLGPNPYQTDSWDSRGQGIQLLCEVSTLVSDQIIGFPFVSRFSPHSAVARRKEAGLEGRTCETGPGHALVLFPKQRDITTKWFLFSITQHWQLNNKIFFLGSFSKTELKTSHCFIFKVKGNYTSLIWADASRRSS